MYNVEYSKDLYNTGNINISFDNISIVKLLATLVHCVIQKYTFQFVFIPILVSIVLELQ